jgi:hypothetical protein
MYFLFASSSGRCLLFLRWRLCWIELHDSIWW